LLRRTVLLTVGLALALPSVAAAATIQFNPPITCIEPGKSYPLAGSGYTPERAMTVAYEGLTTTFYPNSSGALPGNDESAITMPEYDSYTPKTLTFVATDNINPANTASVSVPTVKFGSNLPVKGKPNKVVTWEFAGFLNSAPIYGHYLYERKEKKTVRFGSGEGPCGTLSKRAVRFPIKKPKNFGTWEIRIDSNPKWVRNSESLAETSFNVAKPRRGR
jgi:hypothetical protein